MELCRRQSKRRPVRVVVDRGSSNSGDKKRSAQASDRYSDERIPLLEWTLLVGGRSGQFGRRPIRCM